MPSARTGTPSPQRGTWCPAPARAAATATRRSPRIPASRNASERGSRDAEQTSIRCLIVDDNPAFLEAARAFLERDGLTVSGLARNGAEAVQQADALRPDVILVDITLGQESGLDLARRLAEDGVWERATVILISTRSEEEVAELAAESPAAGYLPKAELSADAIGRFAEGRADERASGRPET